MLKIHIFLIELPARILKISYSSSQRRRLLLLMSDLRENFLEFFSSSPSPHTAYDYDDAIMFFTCFVCSHFQKQKSQRIVSWMRTGETQRRPSSRSYQRRSRTSCWKSCKRSSIRFLPTFSWPTCQHRTSWGMLIRRGKIEKSLNFTRKKITSSSNF